MIPDSGRDKDGATGSDSHPPAPDEVAKVLGGIALALGTIAFLPIVYAIGRYVDIDMGGTGVTILNGIRPLWFVPLVYLWMAVGTLLLFPGYFDYFWLFHLMLVHEGYEAMMVILGNEPYLMLPLEIHDEPLRVAGVLGATAILLLVAWRLFEWDVVRKYRQRLAAGQYLLPFESITSTSDEFVAQSRVGLEKDRSLLVLGETGAGKTATLSLLTYQLDADPDEPFVVFDYKGEYREYLETDGYHDRDVIRLTSSGATHQWNLFEEIEHPSEITELGRAMFPETEGSEFFTTAARQLFVAVVTYLHWRAQEEETTPTNADLVTYIQQTDKATMYDHLTEREEIFHNVNIGAATAAIDPEAERQAAGVYANFQQVIADMFREDFARHGDFSIREYMENPDGRTLLLEFMIREGDAVAPAFRFFIDWGARYALTDDRGSYFLLDEFARLPGLRMAGDLINAGRSSNTQILLGVQSVAQLYDTYGRDTAKSLLGGLVQSVILRLGDKPSREYARGQLGREQDTRTVPDHDYRGRSVGNQEIQDEQYPIAESDLARLNNGEAIAIMADGWIRGQLKELSDVRSRLDRALDSVRNR